MWLNQHWRMPPSHLTEIVQPSQDGTLVSGWSRATLTCCSRNAAAKIAVEQSVS